MLFAMTEKDASGELYALSVDARSRASISRDALQHDAARRGVADRS
jgi:hypothetical protein